MASHRLRACLSLLLALSGCAQRADSCPSTEPVGLSRADEIAATDALPFRFPLDASPIRDAEDHVSFGEASVGSSPTHMYHAAEDYHRSAGTPVFAMADGRVSFSGWAGGYGWLVIVDHPLTNLYSLYGHLSPSRWHVASGIEVRRGELLAYLGDSDENGGSAEQPLEPHLHFGIRAGQRTPLLIVPGSPVHTSLRPIDRPRLRKGSRSIAEARCRWAADGHQHG